MDAIETKEIEVGDVVDIFEYPVTEQMPEGKARVLEIIQDINNGYVTAYVEFIEKPGRSWYRVIKKAKE